MELPLPFKTILIFCKKLSKKLRLEIIEWFQIHRDKRNIDSVLKLQSKK